MKLDLDAQELEDLAFIGEYYRLMINEILVFKSDRDVIRRVELVDKIQKIVHVLDGDAETARLNQDLT